MTADEVRDALMDQLSLGREVIPFGACDDFDFTPQERLIPSILFPPKNPQMDDTTWMCTKMGCDGGQHGEDCPAHPTNRGEYERRDKQAMESERLLDENERLRAEVERLKSLVSSSSDRIAPVFCGKRFGEGCRQCSAAGYGDAHDCARPQSHPGACVCYCGEVPPHVSNVGRNTTSARRSMRFDRLRGLEQMAPERFAEFAASVALPSGTPAEVRAADRLAGEVCHLVDSCQIDARSRAGDALLDYASLRHGDADPITNVRLTHCDVLARLHIAPPPLASSRSSREENGAITRLMAMVESAQRIIDDADRTHANMGNFDLDRPTGPGGSMALHALGKLLPEVRALTALRVSPAVLDDGERTPICNEDTHYWLQGVSPPPDGAQCQCGARTWPVEDSALLRGMVEQARLNHPLPWRVERDWGVSVEAATGRVFFGTEEECRRIIALAEQQAKDSDAFGKEFDALMQSDDSRPTLSTQEKARMKVCPKCGSDAGYCEKLRVSGFETYFGGWGDDPEYANNDDVRYAHLKRVQCIACGANVPREKAIARSPKEESRG